MQSGKFLKNCPSAKNKNTLIAEENPSATGLEHNMGSKFQ